MLQSVIAILTMSQLTACLSIFASKKVETTPSTLEQSSAADHEAEIQDRSLRSAPEPGRPTVVNSPDLEGIELKQARLWARVDELESLVKAQKAKIKLLEKGLMLGVVPEGLGESADKKSLVTKLEDAEEPAGEAPTSPAKPVEVDEAAASAPVPNSPGDGRAQEFQEKMALARDLFQAGRYGKAYLEFSKIDKEFTDDITSGEQKYWLGRCWYKLKEYQTAIQGLKGFVARFPTSPWAPSAKFFLAKSELDLGLRDAAVKHFQEIIRDHPYEGTAEAAKQALGSLEKAL